MLSGARPAAGQDPRLDDAESAILELRYRPVVDTAFIAVYHDGDFYLPILELLDILGVYVEYDAAAHRARGFYASRENGYRIDFDSARAVVGGRARALDAEDVLIGELDVYVSPAILQSVFGLDVRVDARQLVVDVFSEVTLPVASSARRAQMLADVGDAADVDAAPLRFPRRRHLAEPGVLDYLVSATPLGVDPSAAFRFAGGMELFGGSLEAEARGGLRDELDVYDAGATWRYVVDGRRWLTHAGVGRIRSNGLEPFDLWGVELGNDPIRVRSRMGTHVVDGRAPPGYDVELRANGQAVGFTRTDATGLYRFAIPLSYGSTDLVVRVYGPHGDVQESEQRIQIPFDLVPDDTIDYRLALGRIDDSDLFAAQGRLAYGLTERVTNTVGFDLVSDSGSFVPFDRVTARLPGGPIVSATLAPNAFYRADGSLVLPGNAAFTVAFASFDGASLHNPLGLAWESRASAFQPFTVAGRNLALRLGGTFREFRDSFDQVDLDTEVRTTFGAYRPYVRYSLRRQMFERPGRKALETQELLGGVMIYVNPPERLRGWLGGTLLQASLAYDVERSELLAADFSIGRNLAPALRMEIASRHDFRSGFDRFEARAVWDHPFARSSTVLRAGPGLDVTQSVAGTVGYAAGLDDVVFSRRPAVGRAATSIRTYLDLDGDGVFDDAEPLVPNVQLRFDQPVVRQESEPGVLLVPDLVPYVRYRVDVDVSRVRNPTWVPAFETFALELSPNWVRPIELPFVVSGLLEGAVTRSVAGENRPVAGLRVLIRSIDGARTIAAPTFSDGVFYEMAVPPGRYVVEPDSTQLDRLRLDALPARYEIEVKATPAGDLIGGLEFRLVPRAAPAAPPAATSAEEIRSLEGEVEVGEGGEQHDGAAAQDEQQER